MSFDQLGLRQSILDALTEQGYEKPSPIQEKAIPLVLEGKDLMAAAQTGTGKTAGFSLPIIEKLIDGPRAKDNQVRALILTPTRELAAQVHENVEQYCKNIKLSSMVVFGGIKINPQMMRMRRGVDILVATPGRLLDLMEKNSVRFKQLEFLVLDEADRMLDMGFIHDIKKIMAKLPEDRQNLLFSATFSDEIRTLAKMIVNNPTEISVSPPNTTVDSVRQWLVSVDKSQKPKLLAHLIKKEDWQQVLVFTRTKHGANKLTKFLENEGIRAAAIHGNKSQGARTKALTQFKSNTIKVLVATDIAARGIDIDQLPQVVNFDLPNVAEDYVHRIGRTGRAGATGQAVSFVTDEEYYDLQGIETLIKKLVDREEVEGFVPTRPLKASVLNLKGKKIKKPKQPARSGQGGGHRDGQRDKHRSKQNNGNKVGQNQGNGEARRSKPRRSKPANANGNADSKENESKRSNNKNRNQSNSRSKGNASKSSSGNSGFSWPSKG